MKEYKYKAFISYSHKDERWGRWLHRRLEAYPIPSNLVGVSTKAGIIPKRLKPIFRDKEELAAANSLGEKIENALADSENLIIICSPNAAGSQWVNQEVLTFKRNNRDAKIFSLIVDGVPFASDIVGQETTECFPKALRYNIGSDGVLTKEQAEPLAADIRTHGDGKRLGVLKLVSGIIGVGLDEVIQRDMHRGRKRVMAITASALGLVLAMSTLTGFALSARKDAELRRNDAEGLIEFMLTDLKDNLKSVGRLDALNIVGERAEGYYDNIQIKEKEIEARGRRARVYHFLGELHSNLGDNEKSRHYFDQAYFETKKLLTKYPKNANRIYDHAQSSFWLGYYAWMKREFNEAQPYFEEYLIMSKKLKVLEPQSLRGNSEELYATTNLATFFARTNDEKSAILLYNKIIPVFLNVIEKHPNEGSLRLDLADVYSWLAETSEKLDPSVSLIYRDKQTEIYIRLLQEFPDDKFIKLRSVEGFAGVAGTYLRLNRITQARSSSEMAFPISRQLWALDPDDIRVLKNLTLLILLDAEISLIEKDFARTKLAIGKLSQYDEVLNEKYLKSDVDNYYTRLKKRREKIELTVRRTELSILNRKRKTKGE